MEQVQEADTAGATPKMVMEARKLYEPTITALRAALAQPEQRMGNCLLTGVCATEGHRIQKAQHEWQGLTDDDFIGLTTPQIFAMKFAEAKLREKNT